VTKTRQNQISHIVHACVAGKFADMLNWINQGRNFQWSEFVQMCEGEAEFWPYIHLASERKEDKEYCVKIAKEYAEHLLDRSGMLNQKYEQIGYAYIAKKSGEVYISRNEDSVHRFPIYRKV
jgi:hypothetical protein